MKDPLLIVDDDIVDQMLVKKAVKELNFTGEILTYSNGEEALNYLKDSATKPFLILSDVNMPRMGGLELLRELRNNNQVGCKNVPFIILSASMDANEVDEAFNECINGFFDKSMDYGSLLNTLRKIIDYWSESKRPCMKSSDIF